MKKVFQLILIAIITIISSCKKNEVTTTPDPIVPFETGKAITTVVAGKVTAQDGTALNNVEITIGTSTTVTDADGNFIIPKATLSEKASFIKATKAGYFGGSRTIIAKEKVVNNVVIQLVKKTISGDFANSTGGTISVATGGSIVFPANSVVTKSGAAYTGTVKVSAYFLDPTSSNCYREMPGDLRGINASNNEQILTSYGMMAVELNGSNGEALQLATGKNATVTFPIAAATQSVAPTTIPLWFFDETKGMWVEQGSATKIGNNYVGTVSHFTWWNCGYGSALVRYKAKYVDQIGNPISNVIIKLTRTDTATWNSTIGWTASDGSIEGGVPSNVVLKVYLYTSFYCSNNYIQLPDIGPFTTDTDGGNIAVTIPTNTTRLTIKGTVNDCNNAPVANGYAILHIGSSIEQTYISNGILNFTKSYCTSVPAGNVTVDVFDLTSLKQNTTPAIVNITGAGTYSTGIIQACGIQNYIHYNAKFVDQNGSPLTSYYVSFIGDSTTTVYAQSSTINAVVQANRLLIRKVRIKNPCGDYVFADSTQIGPFISDFNAGTIAINIPQSTTFSISGNVNNCNNTPVISGSAIIFVDGKTYTTLISNGSFSAQITRCNSNTVNATITITDYTNSQQNSTTSLTVTNTNVNIGTVLACGTSTSQFLTYTINGTTYNLDSASIQLIGSSTQIFGMVKSSTLKFDGDFSGLTLGNYSMNLTQRINFPNYLYWKTDATHTVNISITEYGNIGQYIAGAFSGSVYETFSQTNNPVTGSFRIKRTQ